MSRRARESAITPAAARVIAMPVLQVSRAGLKEES
jgi:hypothetical protein